MQLEICKTDALSGDIFDLFDKKWTLITAGDAAGWNTMTASWGGMGVLWNKNVCFIFVRPGRYTYEFLEREEYFTCSFFEPQWKDALVFCGSISGREVDKAKETGLTPVYTGEGITFEQARLCVVVKKLYFQDINPENFLVPGIEKNYPAGDYHRMYIGEIEKVLK